MRLHATVKKRAKKAKRASANWCNTLIFTAKIQSRNLVKRITANLTNTTKRITAIKQNDVCKKSGKKQQNKTRQNC